MDFVCLRLILLEETRNLFDKKDKPCAEENADKGYKDG